MYPLGTVEAIVESIRGASIESFSLAESRGPKPRTWRVYAGTPAEKAKKLYQKLSAQRTYVQTVVMDTYYAKDPIAEQNRKAWVEAKTLKGGRAETAAGMELHSATDSMKLTQSRDFISGYN